MSRILYVRCVHVWDGILYVQDTVCSVCTCVGWDTEYCMSVLVFHGIS